MPNLQIIDAGLMPYRPAWDRQLDIHEKVLSDELADGALMLVEHPPVITFGRRQDSQKNLLATSALLQSRGVELVETDRGGDITFHGPGQLVAYPIIPLNRYQLNLHSYMRMLEEVVIQTIAPLGVTGARLQGATGVWVKTGPTLAKVCAMGVKLRRWVTLHGLALNVTTDLTFFDLINPCGLGRPVTSLQKLLGERVPAMTEVKERLAGTFNQLLSEPR